MKLGLVVVFLVAFSGCGAPPPDALQSDLTVGCIGSGAARVCFPRPSTAPQGTDCPLTYYDPTPGAVIRFQSFCSRPLPRSLYDKVQICAWDRGNAGKVGYQGINNSWCGELPMGARIPDLAADQYQDPDHGQPWQFSAILMGTRQQVALCTDRNFSGACYFFGRGGIPGTDFIDLRPYTQDASGRPYSHPSLAVQ